MKKIIYSPFGVSMLLVLLFSACTFDNQETLSPNPTPTPGNSPVVIWSGPTLTFSKAAGADPSLEENQDRLTDNVWITRGNRGGQIYNAAEENSANKNTSPAGTQWARGTTANLSILRFNDFRATVGQPKNIVGQDLVMFLVKDSIYIDIKITDWLGGQVGGFTYERSTE
ncbi:MAG: hypothetical protein AAF135_24060 [Bacteroidota bacterium]